MIRDKMKASQSRKKSYHDKRRKDLEFQEGDHVFLRVTPVTGVGRALKSKKLTPRFIAPYQILERVGTVRGKDIPLVRVVWSGATGESLTWELESKMLESYPELFA